MQTVLIVSDDWFLQDVIACRLNEVGCETLCSSWSDAITQTVERPALVIIDSQAPASHAWALLDNIRAISDRFKAPILVLSESPMARSVLRPYRAQQLMANLTDVQRVQVAVQEMLAR